MIFTYSVLEIEEFLNIKIILFNLNKKKLFNKVRFSKIEEFLNIKIVLFNLNKKNYLIKNNTFQRLKNFLYLNIVLFIKYSKNNF